MSDVANDTRAEAFSKAVRWLVRPLVRALIAQGVTAQALYQIVKRTYVEVAEEELVKSGEKATDSRINVLTGVHRRDIRAFREAIDKSKTDDRRKVTMIASVLGRWLGDPGTTDQDGHPLPIPRTNDEGPSFDGLVHDVSRDIRPRTVLDELTRQGLAEVDSDGLIHLKAEAFFGPADLDQRVHFFAANVGDHIAAAADNLLSEEPPFMERAVFYNHLRSQSVDDIEARARKRATTLLVDLNRMAHQKQEEDMKDPDGTHRFRFGVFFYREDEVDSQAAPDKPLKADRS